jgi:hypothetical protein
MTMPMQTQAPNELPYEQSSDFQWTEAAFLLLEAGGLTARVMTSDNVRSAVIEGTCPRCKHHITDRRSLTAITTVIGDTRTSGSNPAGSMADPKPLVLDVTCSCGVLHPTPDGAAAPSLGAAGCGTSFRIELVAESGAAGGQP